MGKRESEGDKRDVGETDYTVIYKLVSLALALIIIFYWFILVIISEFLYVIPNTYIFINFNNTYCCYNQGPHIASFMFIWLCSVLVTVTNIIPINIFRLVQ